MKRSTAVLLLLLCAFTMVACNKKGQDYLNGEVKEISESEILLACIDESTGQLTGTEISVAKRVVAASGVPEIEAGDRIRMVYDFDSVEEKREPLKITKVYAIYLLDENWEVIPDT